MNIKAAAYREQLSEELKYLKTCVQDHEEMALVVQKKIDDILAKLENSNGSHTYNNRPE